MGSVRASRGSAPHSTPEPGHSAAAETVQRQGPQRDGEFEAKVQVKSGHYGPRYESPPRWVNYGAQVHAILERSPRSVLEVGVGTGTVAAVLRSRGVAVTTFDIDPSLRPDIVGSAHELDRYIEPKSFDAVLCAEVLEHLPYRLLPLCASQLARAARQSVVISLPRRHWGLWLHAVLPKLGVRQVFLSTMFPRRWPRHQPVAEHYWEVGWREFREHDVFHQLALGGLTVEWSRVEPADPAHVVLSCRPGLPSGGASVA